jgi:glucose-6-phosphate dehydrogenase assembly protein OpcA
METQTHASTGAVSISGIDVSKLEKELATMWQPAPNEDGTKAESGVTRVCVLNLIVYSSQREDQSEIDRLLDEVTEQTPSRAIILVVNREATDTKLEAYVSTRCQVGARGGKQVCGEQITIEASGPVIETVSTAIEPLLIPDVPVFLWWKDIPHYEDKLFNRLVGMANRVVIDSLVFDHPHEDLLRVAEIIQGRPQFMMVSDINWGRLTSWRTLLASFYDVPDYRPLLGQIDSVIVEYDPPDIAPDQIATQALLILGWVASRLGWRWSEETPRLEGQIKQCALQTSGNRGISLEFRPAPDRAGHDGLLASLTLRAEQAGAEFHVATNEEGTKLETEARLGDARHIGRVLAYEQKSEGQRLARELGILLRDQIYEEAVTALAPVLANHKLSRS